MRTFAEPGELVGAVGARLGESGFQPVGQERIDRFAAVTGDRQWIHVDTERARAGPFGATIAHGYLTLSMLPPMLDEILVVDGVDVLINKGLDRLRFRAPVPAGARVRAVARLASATRRPRGYTEVVIDLTVEIEGGSTPALTASQRLLYHRAGTD